jgi:hypothetical protein
MAPRAAVLLSEGVIMTHDRRSSGVSSSRRSRSASWRFGRWTVVTAAAALSVTISVLPVDIGAASSSSLGKVSVITGSVSECGAGSTVGLRRPFTISLHVRSNDRVVATTTLMASTHLSYYAFAVGPGTYFLTTSEATSPPPRGNIVVRASSKDIVEVTISTVCQ